MMLLPRGSIRVIRLAFASPVAERHESVRCLRTLPELLRYSDTPLTNSLKPMVPLRSVSKRSNMSCVAFEEHSPRSLTQDGRDGGKTAANQETVEMDYIGRWWPCSGGGRDPLQIGTVRYRHRGGEGEK